MSYIFDENTVIAADLDGTLAESKSPIGPEMIETISKWLQTRRFAIISGGGYERFQKQVISMLPPETRFENLYLFPINGAACYTFKDGTWIQLYEESLTAQETGFITAMLKEAVKKSGLAFDEIYGEQIENRGGQVSFSALGQEAPLSKKVLWDPDQSKRRYITTYLIPTLPDFKVGIGGATTIDVTRKGIDKAFALKKMMELLAVDEFHVIFFGDALFEGGNDWPATTTGVECIKVVGPADAAERIRSLK